MDGGITEKGFKKKLFSSFHKLWTSKKTVRRRRRRCVQVVKAKKEAGTTNTTGHCEGREDGKDWGWGL